MKAHPLKQMALNSFLKEFEILDPNGHYQRTYVLAFIKGYYKAEEDIKPKTKTMKTEKPTFDNYYLPRGYAAETLINGNFTHCVEYLRGLLNYGTTGAKAMHEELQLIKEYAPDRYNTILSRI